MLERIVEASLQRRVLVSLILLLVVAVGMRALLTLSVDAFPDTTPIQVQVNTVAPALNPEEIERQVTFPLETAISGIPGLVNVRSVSKFGFCQVVATFEDDVEILDARQLITERIGTVELPDGIGRPALGPISTGLGEVLHYIVSSPDGSHDLTELRTIHDWIITPELRRIPGVAEVNAWGGYVKQYQVVVKPEALLGYGLTLDGVVEALEKNNRNVGGGVVRTSGEGLLVHGVGRLETMEQIGDVVITTRAGVPIHIDDVADVSIGHEIRRGAVTANGGGEVVLGLGFMLMGENSKEVTERLKEGVEGVRDALPEGVEIEVVYDRSELVDHVIKTVLHNLILGAILVTVILFLLFGSMRVGLIIALTIPLAMIMAALGMRELGIAASLLSLGAMDFGILVDGSVVMTENIHRRLGRESAERGRDLTPGERLRIVAAGAREIVRPVFFGVAIITLVLVPVLTLEGTEGKMFRPMALTLIFALAGALLVALVITPALCYWGLPKRSKESESRVGRRLLAAYERGLRAVLRHRRAAVGVVVLLAVVVGLLVPTLGAEFVPRLKEGAVVFNVVRLAGISIEQSVDYNTRMERLILESFPDEVESVWSRIGTAEVATDPMGTELTDIFIALTPRSEWVRARTQEELADQIQVRLSGFPGQTLAYTQPIEMRVNEMSEGIRTDLGIKVYGDDFEELTRISGRLEGLLSSVEGSADVSVEQLTGQPVLKVHINAEAISRAGVSADEVLRVVEAVGGVEAGDIQEGQLVFSLVARLPEVMRRDPAALESMLVPTSSGAVLPLGALADVETVDAPSTITREWGRRRALVQSNIRGRDVGSFVKEVRRRVRDEVSLPAGYTVEFGGQFEKLERANRRFAIVVPLTLLVVFFLLLIGMKRLDDTLIIFSAIPLAGMGGVLALWMRGLPFSVSAAVGFIALSGIAVLNGQILVSTIRSHLSSGTDMLQAVLGAGRLRMRPVLATAITDAAGFLPMAVSTGIGAEVQRPLATVIIGGVLTSTALTLFVLPLLFVLGRKWLGSRRTVESPPV